MFKSLFKITLLLCTFSVLAEVPGQSALERGDYATARAEVAKAAAVQESSALTLMLGRINLAENKLDEAEKLFDSVLETEPANALAHALRGQLFGLKTSRASLFKAGGYARESLASLELSLELDPDMEEALVGMIRYRLNAPRLFGGSIDHALSVVEKLQSINPVAGGLELANIYAEQKDQARQIALLQDLAQSHPNDPRASLALGFMMQRERKWEKASSHFTAAVQAGKNQPEHTSSIQAASYQIGRSAVLSKTRSEIEILEGIDALGNYISGPQFGDLPDLEWAHYRRGLLYARLGKQAEAEQDFSVAATSSDRDLQRALRSF